MKKTILLFCLILTSCSKIKTSNIGSEPDYNFQTGCSLTTYNDTREPDTLIIGDSISIAYTESFRSLNTTRAVIHNQCNGANAGHVYSFLDWYLSQSSSWQIITFNAGIWDYLDESITIEEYSRYLILTAIKLKETRARVMFVTTTEPLIENIRHNAFNDEAKRVMASVGVEICDLGEYSKGLKSYLIDDVHYNSQGSALLAQYITNCLNN